MGTAIELLVSCVVHVLYCKLCSLDLAVIVQDDKVKRV